jgi:hypothetical protein
MYCVGYFICSFKTLLVRHDTFENNKIKLTIGTSLRQQTPQTNKVYGYFINLMNFLSAFIVAMCRGLHPWYPTL